MASNMQGSTRSSSPAWEVSLDEFLDSQKSISLFFDDYLTEQLGEKLASNLKTVRMGMKGFRMQLETNPNMDMTDFLMGWKKVVKFFASSEAGQDFQISYLTDYNEAYKNKEFQVAFGILEELESTMNNKLEDPFWPNFLKSDAFIKFANEDNSIDEEGCVDQSPAKPSLIDPILNTIPEGREVTTVQQKRVPVLPNPEVKDTVPTKAIQVPKPVEKEELGDISDLLNPHDPTFDPPDVRDKETLQVRPEFEKNASHQSQSLRHTQGLTYFPEQDLRNAANPANTLRRRGATVTRDYGCIDESMPLENTRNPAAAYHARASTVNHTTRQNSAFHSMATDTSDTYSSFSNEDPERVERRRRHQERRQMRESEQANGQSNLSGPFQAKPSTNKVVKPGDHDKLARTDKSGFFRLLNEKLMGVITERKKEEKRKESIRTFREMMKAQADERKSNPAMSQVGEDYEETDDSILDDAINRHEISQKLEEIESSRTDFRRNARHKFGSSDDLLSDRSRGGYNQNHQYTTSTMRSSSSTSNRNFGDGQSIISRAPSSFQAVTRVPSIQAFENHNGGDQRFNTMRSTHSQFSSSHRNPSQDQFGQNGLSNGYGNNQHFGQSRSNGFGQPQKYGHSGSSNFGGQTAQSQYGYRHQQNSWGYNWSMNQQNSQSAQRQNGGGSNEMMSRFNQMSLDRKRHNKPNQNASKIEVLVQMPDRNGKEEKHTIPFEGKEITLYDIKEELPKRASTIADKCNFYQKQYDPNLGGWNFTPITPSEPLKAYGSRIELRAA